MANFEQWAGFEGRNWKSSVDVRDFIQENYTPVSYTHLTLPTN